MTFDIIPYVSAGPLKFGMERVEIQSILGQENVPFTPGGKDVCDYYDALGILVAYDSDLQCAYIALGKPIVALYKGKDLLSLTAKQVGKILADDINLEEYGDGFTSHLHGIGTVFEYKTKPVSRITVFKKGYYSKNNEWEQKLEKLNLKEMSVDEIMNFIEGI